MPETSSRGCLGAFLCPKQVIVGLSSKKCVGSACRRTVFLLASDPTFSDSYVVLVVGSYTVVVEGWSSGFVVGLVLVEGYVCDFGELVITPVALLSDFNGVVRQLRF